MNAWYFDGCPQAPDYALDWRHIVQRFEWIRQMKGIPQNPLHHGEGDVLHHTKMVCETMISFPQWRQLDDTFRSLLFVAALMHDIAKPYCTVLRGDGTIKAKGHARIGGRMVRSLLYTDSQWQDIPFLLREHLVNLVSYHGFPLNYYKKENASEIMSQVYQWSSFEHLVLLAKADSIGRICSEQEQLLKKIETFEAYTDPWRAKNKMDETTVKSIQSQKGRVHTIYPAQHEFTVIFLCGLPFCNMDAWISENLPTLPSVRLTQDISTDFFHQKTWKKSHGERVEKPIVEDENVQLLQAHGDKYLRDHSSFLLIGHLLTQKERDPVIKYLVSRGAKVKLVYLESSFEYLMQQNSASAHPLSKSQFIGLIEILELPMPYEAEEVQWFY